MRRTAATSLEDEPSSKVPRLDTSDLEHLTAENLELRTSLETVLKEKNDLVTYHEEQEERISSLEQNLNRAVLEHKARLAELRDEKAGLEKEMKRMGEELGRTEARMKEFEEERRVLLSTLQEVNMSGRIIFHSSFQFTLEILLLMYNRCQSFSTKR